MWHSESDEIDVINSSLSSGDGLDYESETAVRFQPSLGLDPGLLTVVFVSYEWNYGLTLLIKKQHLK
jgi:hypothetical protein